MVAVPSIGRASQVTPRRSAPEADATRDLYERYARQIYTYCLHQLGNREEAEDAVQSTFLNAFRGYQRGVDPEFESAWIYKIAQNVCLTRQRSSSRRRRVETASDLDAMQDYVPAHEIDADELIHLPEALDAMPHQQRKALLLREWQGLSYKEIAEELGLSQAAVETLLFRARRTLAAGLNEEPAKKGALQRLRSGGDAGSALALLKSLLVTGGAKVATAVVTVAATSVVAATPATRHAVEDVMTPGHDRAPAPAHQVARTAGPAAASPSRVVLPARLAPATAAVVVVKPAVHAHPVSAAPAPLPHLRPLHSLGPADVHSAPPAPPVAPVTALQPVAEAPAPAPPVVDQPAPPSAPVASTPAPAPAQPSPTPAPTPVQSAPASTPDKAKGDEHRSDAPQSSSGTPASPAPAPQAKGDQTKKNDAAAGAPGSSDGGRTTSGVTAPPAPTPAAPAPAPDQGPRSDNGKDNGKDGNGNGNGNGKSKHVDLVPMAVVAPPAAPVATTTAAPPPPPPPPTTTVTTTTTAAPAPAAPPVAQPTVSAPQPAPSDNGNGNGRGDNGNGNGNGNGRGNNRDGNGHRK